MPLCILSTASDSKWVVHQHTTARSLSHYMAAALNEVSPLCHACSRLYRINHSPLYGRCERQMASPVPHHANQQRARAANKLCSQLLHTAHLTAIH